MAVTVDAIEQGMSLRRLSDYISGVASANGNAGGTTILTTSQDIMSRPGQSFVPWFIHLTSGTYAGQWRQITDLTVTSGVATFTVINPFGGMIASGVTFRIHQFPYDWKIAAISMALRERGTVFPLIMTDHFLTGEILRNGNMELWNGNIPYDWEGVSGTIAKYTTSPYQGKAALSLVGASASVRQHIALDEELRGRSITFEGYSLGVIGGSANTPKLFIEANGTTYESPTITAAAWQKLSVTVPIDFTKRTIRAGVKCDHASSVAYFDALTLKAEAAAYCYWLPMSEAFRSIDGLYFGDIPQNTDTPLVGSSYYPVVRPGEVEFGGFSRYMAPLTRDIPVTILGDGYWPEITAGTDSIEIPREKMPLLEIRAAINVLNLAIRSNYLSANAIYKANLADLVQEELELRRHIKVPSNVRINTLPEWR
jgi:hypothetical protein